MCINNYTEKSIGNVHSIKYYESEAKETIYVQKDDIQGIKWWITADVLFVIGIFLIEEICSVLSYIFYQKQFILYKKNLFYFWPRRTLCLMELFVPASLYSKT